MPRSIAGHTIAQHPHHAAILSSKAGLEKGNYEAIGIRLDLGRGGKFTAERNA